MSDLPSWGELLKIAPIAVIMMSVIWGSVWIYRRFHNEDRDRERGE